MTGDRAALGVVFASEGDLAQVVVLVAPVGSAFMQASLTCFSLWAVCLSRQPRFFHLFQDLPTLSNRANVRRYADILLSSCFDSICVVFFEVHCRLCFQSFGTPRSVTLKESCVSSVVGDITERFQVIPKTIQSYKLRKSRMARAPRWKCLNPRLPL